uniref:Uncharacterized protein n=1 Tax=Glossina brevipalpis TaxID=37001 RepID=A0A1A9WAU8_9MUSC
MNKNCQKLLFLACGSVITATPICDSVTIMISFVTTLFSSSRHGSHGWYLLLLCVVIKLAVIMDFKEIALGRFRSLLKNSNLSAVFLLTKEEWLRLPGHQRESCTNIRVYVLQLAKPRAYVSQFSSRNFVRIIETSSRSNCWLSSVMNGLSEFYLNVPLKWLKTNQPLNLIN